MVGETTPSWAVGACERLMAEGKEMYLLSGICQDRPGNMSGTSSSWLERRPRLVQYERLIAELREEDVSAFRNFVGWTRKCFGSFISVWAADYSGKKPDTERHWIPV